MLGPGDDREPVFHPIGEQPARSQCGAAESSSTVTTPCSTTAACSSPWAIAHLPTPKNATTQYWTTDLWQHNLLKLASGNPEAVQQISGWNPIRRSPKHPPTVSETSCLKSNNHSQETLVRNVKRSCVVACRNLINNESNLYHE